VLKHPLAVQVLTVCNEEVISPTRFVEERFRPRPKTEREFKKALSQVPYHFRCLEKAGLIEIEDMIPRRGAFEKRWKGKGRAQFSVEEWADVEMEERYRISTVTWQGLVARVEVAMLAGTFDQRDDRSIAWTAGKLDERGWAELTEVMAASYSEFERIREDSEARLAETEGAGEGDDAMPVTFAMLGFESP
jgi:hypothetical protein